MTDYTFTDNDLLCEGVDDSVPLRRCIYMREGLFTTGGFPLLLYFTRPNAIGVYSEFEIVRFKGEWTCQINSGGPIEITSRIGSGQDEDKHWYPGFSYQLQVALEYFAAEHPSDEKMTARCEMDLDASDLEFDNFGIGAIGGGLCASGLAQLFPSIGDKTQTPMTRFLCDPNVDVVMLEENIVSEFADDFSGAAFYMLEEAPQAQELIDPDCFKNEQCAVETTGLLGVPGSFNGDPDDNKWFVWGGELSPFTSERVTESGGTPGNFGYFLYGTCSSLTWSYNGQSYFRGAGRYEERAEEFPPHDTIFTHTAENQSYWPLYRPFMYDPTCTYTFVVELVAGRIGDNWAGPSDTDPVLGVVQCGIAGMWNILMERTWPAGGAGSPTYAVVMSPKPLNAPPYGVGSLADGAIPDGGMSVTIVVSPHPTLCELVDVVYTSPFGSFATTAAKETGCRFIAVGMGGTPLINTSGNPERHAGVKSISCTVEGPDDNEGNACRGRPSYELCVFYRYRYPTPWTNFGPLPSMYDWRFYKFENVELEPSVVEMEAPLKVRIECGSLPDGLVLDPLTGRITGAVDVAVPNGTTGFVNFRVRDNRNNEVVTEIYTWIVEDDNGNAFGYFYTSPLVQPVPNYDLTLNTIHDGESILPTISGDIPVSFEYASGTFPPGWDVDPVTGALFEPSDLVTVPQTEGFVQIKATYSDGSEEFATVTWITTGM